MLNKLTELHELARSARRKKLALAAAHDQHAIEAVINAYKNGIIDAILIGDKQKILAIEEKTGADLSSFEVIDEPDNDLAAARAVKLVSSGEADILMKGHLGTSSLLRAVLNKEWGLRSGELLSHLAFFEIPAYHKIIGLTDAAMNLAPDLKSKIAIIRNAVGYFHALGINKPKVAMLSAVETVNPDLKSSVESAMIAKMSERGQIPGCVIDGPFALDNAISEKSAYLKGIQSPVAGDADLLVGDDLDVSNALYKAFIFFGQAQCAAIISGAKAP
ncbi:MAG: bifunctional enoyl-CoA hydratase/phosphate acetyltransferase, partial [Cyclobacteriaceae bacterium]